MKDPLAPHPPPDDDVQAHMDNWRQAGSYTDFYRSRTFCAETCPSQVACAAARALADDEYVQRTLSRIMTTTADEPEALARLWEDLTTAIGARRPPAVPLDDLLHAYAGHGTDWLATRRGAQRSWTYTDTEEFRARMRAMLLDRLDTGGLNAPALTAAFKATVHRLHARQFEPYPACHLVCTQDPPLCLYRSAVADLVAGRRYHPLWSEADQNDGASEDKRRVRTWEVCQDAAYELVEFPTEDAPEEARKKLDTTARRVCLCFEQQMLADDRRKVPRTTRRILARVLKEAGL